MLTGRSHTLQDTGLSALTDARYSDWLKDRPYRNALDLSVLSMKPQMVKARLADSSKVLPACACAQMASAAVAVRVLLAMSLSDIAESQARESH